MRSHISELEAVQQALEGEVASLKGQLAAEQARSRALEESRNEVCVKGRGRERE